MSRLSKGEIRKDAAQDTVTAAATAVGQVSTIITAAVKDVAGALGGLATEIFEIRDSARRASLDSDRDADPGTDLDPGADRGLGVLSRS